MSQLDMFGSTQRRAVERPTADDVRPRLTSVLDRLATSETMPLSVKDLRFWRVVFPQMARWLPPEERERLCDAFQAELARLSG